MRCIGSNARRTLAEHWNGTASRQVHTPTTRGQASLRGVAALSARNAWAVGLYGAGTELSTPQP